MVAKKYQTEEERLEARRKQKREWARRNKERIKENYQRWVANRKIKKELRERYTTEELIENIEQIKEDFKVMSERQVQDKWGRHRRTLKRLVKNHTK